MHREDTGLQAPPPADGNPPWIFVQYRAQREAFDFLHGVLEDPRGVGLLHGPEGSGKSTLVRQFLKGLPATLALAMVDGSRMHAPQLLSRILSQFGYQLDLSKTDELLNMLNVLLVQQTSSNQPPLLVLENISNMYPSALSALCKLAALAVGERHALRIVLVSSRQVDRILESPGMSEVATRVAGHHELGPMTPSESLTYLHARLRHRGVERPDKVLPANARDKLFMASGGYPGRLDGIASYVVDRSNGFPLRLAPQAAPAAQAAPEPAPHPQGQSGPAEPTLLVSRDGKVIQQFQVGQGKYLVGRSALADICLEDDIVSKHHALLMRVDDSVVLVDLKSTNGTYVNSRQVYSRVLQQDDIVSLGNHRLKVRYGDGQGRSVHDPNTADTTQVLGIVDARRARIARELALAEAVPAKA